MGLFSLTNNVSGQILKVNSDTLALEDSFHLYYEVVTLDSSVIPFIDYKYEFRVNSTKKRIDKTYNFEGTQVRVNSKSLKLLVVERGKYHTFKVIIKYKGGFIVFYVENFKIVKIIHTE